MTTKKRARSSDLLKFLSRYFSHPLRVGAVAPSSRYLARAMMEGIDFDSTRLIVEFGPGTGIFTDEIIARMHQECMLVTIEIDPHYAEYLRGKYHERSNVVVVEDSAGNLEPILDRYNLSDREVGAIVSGLPTPAIPKPDLTRMISSIRRNTETGAKFRMFTYAPSVMIPYYD
ncbi:MAG TPA: rRNA adenine N-6-methyltransferase family protein [bacterium]|nr:rRNA adenine N-6-methyltransferase family protein [bacterium]